MTQDTGVLKSEGQHKSVQGSMPDISVIIPCFNSGKFLPDAINSVKAYKGPHSYEIIVTNDGSTDAHTLHVLEEYRNTDVHIINQENKGPAAARNAGASAAKADLLLFLDSDNRIKSEFIDRGVKVMRAEPGIGVLYGNALFFGEDTKPRFTPKPFNGVTIILGNYIDMCSIIRKATWLEVGPLDESRIIFGHEDWEYWIRIGKTKWKFKYLQEELFEYRIRKNSLLVQSSNEDNLIAVRQYVYAKHLEELIYQYRILLNEYTFYEHDQKAPLRTFLKYLYFKTVGKKKTFVRVDTE